MCTEEMATESPADCFSPPPRPASTETISSCSESTDTGDPPATYKPRRNKAARPAMRLSASHGCSHPSPFSQLLELTPELQEHIAQNLSLRELSSLAVTCRAATPLQSSVISMRIMELRSLIKSAHGSLLMQISRLPRCLARDQITGVIESSMLTFWRVCSCNEEFLRLSRAVALRGVAAPFTSPLDAARLAKSCCQTCDDITRALLAVSEWLNELLAFVEPPRRSGEPTQEETPSSAVGAQADVPAPAVPEMDAPSSGHVDVADSEVASHNEQQQSAVDGANSEQ